MSTEDRAPAGLGRLVRERRNALGMTQRALAERTGIAQPHVSDIERGRVQHPNAEMRRRLAAALGLTNVDLLIAAGELAEAEVPGHAGHPPTDPKRFSIYALVDQADLTPDRVNSLRILLRAWRDRPAPDEEPDQ